MRRASVLGQLVRANRLSKRGGVGIVCDEDGIALGPLPLVIAVGAGKDKIYVMQSAGQIVKALRLANPGQSADFVEWRLSQLVHAAEALNAGNQVAAAHAVIRMRLFDLSPEALRRIAADPTLQKFSLAQPRVPKGNSHAGEWTNEDNGSGAQGNSSFLIAARRTQGATLAQKQAFVRRHLKAATDVARRLGITPASILALAALESEWGAHRFATQGNNYFGLHHHAPLAIGSMKSGKDGLMSTFSSFSQAANSFAIENRRIIENITDPTAFATALQESRKFGIDTETGVKVPTYVPELARTIRGIERLIDGM